MVDGAHNVWKKKYLGEGVLEAFLPMLQPEAIVRVDTQVRI